MSAFLPSTKQADPYLARLRDLGLIRRELPATVPETKRATSRLGRYVLADHYLRFYFRFIWPKQGLLEQRLHDRLWDLISEQLRAFVGETAFEEICREWVLGQARAGRLPFSPDRLHRSGPGRGRSAGLVARGPGYPGSRLAGRCVIHFTGGFGAPIQQICPIRR